jgi:Cu/Ag efflux pump CusA
MKIGLSSKTIPLTDMSMIAYWTIRARLLGVPGVANVAIWGERIKMPQVQVDPDRLRLRRVSLDQVMEVTADALDVGILQFSKGAVIGTGGFIQTPNQRLGIRHVLAISSPEDLGQVPILDKKRDDGTPLRLSDVADVVWDTWPLFGDAVINDGPGLMPSSRSFPGPARWTSHTASKRRSTSSRPGLAGIELDPTIFRPADFIRSRSTILSHALILGCILVMLVIVAFLFQWRTALISMVAIPCRSPRARSRAPLQRRDHQHHDAGRLRHRHRRGGG